jgi:hypothetical protein
VNTVYLHTAVLLELPLGYLINSPSFMESKGSLLSSQELTTDSYPEPGTYPAYLSLHPDLVILIIYN